MKGCNLKIYWRVMQILCLLFFCLLIIYMFNCKIYGNYLLQAPLANITWGRKNECTFNFKDYIYTHIYIFSEDKKLENQELNS